ncbi:MAG TPA: hypothetical protein VH138_13030 [Vicinamibacterales bacterium]|nr:hypothetical protein [Vicinamibacterales bacterium]
MIHPDLAADDRTRDRRHALMIDAEARGKDLIADQVRRLKRDITAARNRLDAMTL